MRCRRASSIAEVVDIMTTLERELSERRRIVVVQPPVPARDARGAQRGDDDHVSRSGISRAARRRVRESVFRRGRRGRRGSAGGALGVAAAVRVPAPARHSVDPVRAGGHERAHQPRSSRRDCRGLSWRRTARRAGRRPLRRLQERSTGCSKTVEAQIKGRVFNRHRGGSSTAVGGEVDDAVAMWKVRAARETAWTNAEVLWALRTAPALRDAFFARLDSFTGFAGRGLLVRPAHAADRRIV